MESDFNFIGFSPNESLKSKAQAISENILAVAPYGAMMVGLVQKDELSYRCAMEVYTTYGPFTAQASHLNPETSLNFAFQSISKKLKLLKERIQASHKQKVFHFSKASSVA